MSYGPKVPETNLSDAYIQEEEKKDFELGKASYSDLLYSHYTPCGSIYSRFKNEIPANWRKTTNHVQSKEKIDHIIVNSNLGKDFKKCVESNFMFYMKRKEKLDGYMYSLTEKVVIQSRK